MEDTTIEMLREQRRRRMKKYAIISAFVLGILGILNILVLLIFGAFLMLIGAEQMLDIGSHLVKLRYNPYITTGFHELIEAERENRYKNFSIGIILIILGFLIFVLSLYIHSKGWCGII